MKNISSIAVLGGDKRQLAAAKILNEHFNKVGIWGFSFAECEPLNPINPDEIKNYDAVLLPLPVSKDGTNLFSVCKEKITLKSLALLTGENKTVFAGNADKEFVNLLVKKGCNVFDYYNNQDSIIKNAVLTAQGTLSVILNNIDRSVFELKFAVTGYGKTAQAICFLLHSMGVDVTVFARDKLQRTKTQSRLIKAFPLSEINERAGEYDVFINTVPAMIFSSDIIKKMRKSTLIVDIASAPFGTDFSAAESMGIKAITAPGLPGKATPVSAGRIIAEAVISLAGGE